MVDLAEIQAAYYMVAATGVLVAAGYYILNIQNNKRNQELSLRALEQSAQAQKQAAETRQTQLFMQVFERYHETEFWNIYTTVMNKEWQNYDDWNRDRSDPTSLSMRLAVGTYFEGIGTLVHRGLLPAELVAEILGSVVIMWWDKQSEFYKEFRIRAGNPIYGQHIEYLYNEMKKLRPAGFSPRLKS